MSFLLFMFQQLSNSITYETCACPDIFIANTTVAAPPPSPQCAAVPVLKAPDMISNVVLQTPKPLQATATTATTATTFPSISTAGVIRLAIIIAILTFWAMWLCMPKPRTRATISRVNQHPAANADECVKAASTTNEELFAQVVRLHAQQVQRTAELAQLMHALHQNQDALAAQMKKNVGVMAQEVRDMRREMPELAGEGRALLKDTLAWIKDVQVQNEKAERKMKGVPEGVMYIERMLHEQFET